LSAGGRNGGGEQCRAATEVSANITVYAAWLPADTIGITLDACGLPAAKAIVLAIGGNTEDTLTFSWYLNERIWAAVTSFNGSDYLSDLAFAWFIDGTVVGGEVNFTLNFYAQTYAAGTHRLTVQVTEGGLAYTLTRLFVIDGATPTSGLVSLNPNGGRVWDGGGYVPATGKIIAVGTEGYALPDPSGPTFTGGFEWDSPDPQITVPSFTFRSFVNWNTQADGLGTPYEAGITITTGMTLYAQWTPVWTVSFDLNGVTGTTPGAETVVANAGTALDLPDIGPGPGYIVPPSNKAFAGWCVNANGTGTSYIPAEASYQPTADITLYAKWGNDGLSADNPIEVSTQAELASMADGLNKYYKLTNNIAINNWETLGGIFTGTLDGNGKTITFSGAVSPSGDEYYGNAALFGIIDGGTVKNLNLAGTVTVSGSDNIYAGAVADSLYTGGTIRNVKSTVAVSAESTASMMGSTC
jgi:hypothetical protein